MQFWILQCVGWFGLCLVTYFSLTLWYNASALPYVVHTVIQSLLGALLSTGLRYVYRPVWRLKPSQQLYCVGLIVTLSALVWTLIRLIAFDLVVGEDDLWGDFGGWYFGSFLVFLCWTAFYYGIKYYLIAGREREKRLEALAAMQAERVKRLTAEASSKEARLAMLRYQLNPHFLFNSLNSISALIKMNYGSVAREMLAELGAFLRFSLETEPTKKITLANEVDLLRRYFAIETLRFGEHLHFEVEMSDTAQQALVPNLILQPLIENAILHGAVPVARDVTLRITASCDDTNVHIRVEDDGAGFGTEAPSPRFGLANVTERLQSEYDDAATFTLRPNSPQGAVAMLTLPLRVQTPRSTPEEVTS